jgi:hypothetical protein
LNTVRGAGQMKIAVEHQAVLIGLAHDLVLCTSP